MPYNTTAIPPRKEPTGQTQLPLSRVRKIISVDPDVAVCSNNAAFVITLATEIFVQYLAAEAQNMVKLDRKPRRNIQYKDLASAVRRVDRLEFLEDTVPTTVPYGKVKADAAATQARLRLGADAGDDGVGAGGAGGGGTAGGAGGAGSKSLASSSSSRPDRLSTGSGGPPPTAIASLTNGVTDSTNSSNSSRKKQQQLPFVIMDSVPSNTTTAEQQHDHYHSSGRPQGLPESGPGGGSGGVAAAAALAQAAAASGVQQQQQQPQQQQQQYGHNYHYQGGMMGSPADEPGPDAQLAQDMRRLHDGVPPALSPADGRSSHRYGQYHHPDHHNHGGPQRHPHHSGNVDMQNR
ncbi:cbf nf-y family transcription factor [Niveomyces insectorum RCEF 264]|uniref:Cbf nf-y family transcription factor n=1 Tax=Niveomyces insectorum RCEF 264 TaxID=1081102 RepID=A0A167WVT6_9HYPO|nr:cbf nf-y family transcription factor [Niveomyces insectorum RCEF 264]